MQHLDDGFLHALADGEVPSEELLAVREHLEQCQSCRARLDEARMEAETARELIEYIEVPPPALDGRTEGRDEETNRPTAQPPNRRVWMRTLAWAATLVIAAGIGYYGRGQAPFAPAAQPTSVSRIDTVFLDVPAEALESNLNESRREASLDRASRQPETQALPPGQSAPAARLEAAGARQEEDRRAKQGLGPDTAARREDMLVTAPARESAKPASAEKKEAEAKLGESVRSRAASDTRDQAAGANLARKNAAEPAAPTAVLAEERFLAKSAADAAAVVVTFPRAVELLGGRIRLIEGMVPARLEAVGRMVRVVYVVDEGNLVLSQVSGADSLSWSLAGPLSADSLARLRARVR